MFTIMEKFDITWFNFKPQQYTEAARKNNQLNFLTKEN